MHWRYLCEDRVSDSYGLAADEAMALRVGENLSPPVLRLYTYRSCSALVGRFQRIENELNLEFCREQKMSVNRRPTGGGAILMGEDQLGVALMLRDWNGCKAPRELMRHFASALCEGLLVFGVNAQFRGKNDLEVEGRKIGGLGIHSNAKGGYLLHCSLLVDLDVPLMLRALNVPLEKLEARKLKNIEGRITTVRRELKKDTSLNEVRDKIRRVFSSYFSVEFEQSCYSPEEKKIISEMESSRYLNKDWIYQKVDVPDLSGEARQMTPAGLLDVRVTMAGRQIKAVFLGGDFFAEESAVSDIEGSLRWHSSEFEQIHSTLEILYAKREEELAFLPIENVCEVISKAVESARAISQDSNTSYGCFVNPKIGDAEPVHT
jgi:lipoate-protein ligase A